jgi:hypothetical protein
MGGDPTTPEADLELAKLCATCEKAVFSDSVERYDIWRRRDEGDWPRQDHFEEQVDEDGFPRLVFPEYRLPTSLKALWVDTLPSLPLLHQSSRDGCEFCPFLRTIILSTDTSDAAEHAFGKTLEDMGSSRVEIWAQYYWEEGERWDEEEEKHQASAEKHDDEGSHSPSALTCSNSIPHGNFRNAAPGMDVMSDESRGRTHQRGIQRLDK